MKQPIKVLLIDDNQDYCESLAGVSRQKGIQMVYELDWELGFIRLKTDPLIEFVILDGKGKIETDQEIEHESFAMRAMKDIDAFGNKRNRNIPYCLNTGFLDSFSAFEGNVRIFEKNDAQREEMFKYITDEVKASKYRTLRMPYDEAFKSVDLGIISKDYEALLIEIIKCYNERDFKKKNMNVQRDLLEAIFKSLNDPIPCIPNTFFRNNGSPNQEGCTQYLEGRAARDNNKEEHRLVLPIPKSIRSSFRKLKESTNEFSHLSDEVVVKIPFLANTFLLIEILEWLPEFAKTNYKNYIK